MHAYNAWLPPPVRELLDADPEKDKFHKIVLEIQRYWKLGTAQARFSSLKWISVVNTFLKARSELATSDVELLVKTGLDILLWSSDNLFIQIRWGHCIARVLKKYRNHLELDIEWRPLYKLLYETHFKRRNSYEGLALKQYHLDTVSTLIRCSRRFFPDGSVAEIWNEFRPALDALTHNSGLEAIGFLSLLLPTKLDKFSDVDRNFLSSKWFEECLDLWAALPNSHYWDRQWGSLLSRYTKHCLLSCSTDLDPYLPTLFTHYLRSFEVPVGKSGTSSPVRLDVSREIVLAFNGGGWSVSVSKYFAKAIIYMLKPGGQAESHLRNLIDLLEQYYHPSNGGSWTTSLERFLYHLVMYFQKRLSYEQRRRSCAGAMTDENIFLGSAERISFVKAVLPLVERGQYSKDGYLSGTAAKTASMLSFVEPSLVLPFITARFHTALNTITATHQLESAVTTLALAARPAFLACAKEGVFKKEENSDLSSSGYLEEFTETLVVAMFKTLLGMDANDPPKTLATMELFSSILSNVGIVGDLADGGSLALPIDWSQWLDEFLSRLFVLLVHLEPSSQQIDTTLDDGYDLASSTFLMQAGSFYNSVVELLFGRLTRPLYQQALKKLVEFVHNNALPGAAPEIGFLCSFAVLRDPREATSQLLKPIMNSLVSSLGDFPSTGFGGSHANSRTSKASLSQAVETSVIFQLNILSAAIMFGGSDLLPLKDLFNTVITAAFNAPSSKVTEAGNRLLSSLLGSLIFYYPVDQYKVNAELEDGVEAWISTKLSPNDGDAPSWHIPNAEEIAYANELLDEHLRAPLASLLSICQNNMESEGAGKEFLRVLFLRLDASLRGVGSCLPDFYMAADSRSTDANTKQPLTVVGAFGARVGDRKLREETAEVLHAACQYILKERADDTVLLMMLIRVMDLVGNCATLEYNFWLNGRHLRREEAKCLTEPKMNFITNPDAKSKRRPRWWVIDMVFLHNAWRSSQESYRPVYLGDGSNPVPHHITLVTMDLLQLALHRYDVVRKFSVSALGKSLKRFPALVKECLPVLTGSLENPEAIEDSALGACKVLMLRPVLRHLTQDLGALASFFRSLMKSAHHESVKAQTAINELFVVFSVRFGGLPAFSNAKSNPDCASYAELVSYIKGLLADGGVSIHWRYNLMANGMLLLLLVAPFGEDSSKINVILESRQIVAWQFLSNLKSELPALRPLSIIALLCLLRASLNKVPVSTKSPESLKAKGEEAALSLESTLIPVLKEPGFAGTTVQNLALDHHYPEGQGRSGRYHGARTARISDLGLTALMPPFTRDWPRTRTWDAGSVGEAFAPPNAKLFKRLVQECGPVVLEVLRAPLEEAVSSAERGKQCVAAEIMAGLLHSDVGCVAEAWGPWLRPLLRKALMEATVESAPEWAACIRFACTGKGSKGEDVPLLHFEILDCLLEPVSSTASTSLVAKRLMLLRAALVEFAPVSNPSKEGLLLATFLKEITNNMTHPAPQVREYVGSLLCIVLGILQGQLPLSKEMSSQSVNHQEVGTGGNIAPQAIVNHHIKTSVMRQDLPVRSVQNVAASANATGQSLAQGANENDSMGEATDGGKWTTWAETATVGQFKKTLIEEAKVSAIRIQKLGGPAFGGSAASTKSEDLTISENRDAKWMETVFHFIIACIKSGKAVDMSDTLIGLLHPLLSLQETPVKELSGLAKAALRLVHWHPFPISYLPGAVIAVLDAAADSNWHTRVAALTFIQSFVYRHTFILARRDVEALWSLVQQLLSDPQVEVRELAATTLAGLMKDSDSSLASAFREQVMQGAGLLHNAGKMKKRAKIAAQQPASTATVHGQVLGLAACVLSVPYDMPSWLPDMVTLLGRFIGEPTPIRSTVKKTIAEFRRTHSDTWAYQKSSFSEEQLEVLSDLATSASYFA
ncbi:unnamed protein product [Calypogeia fissa]